MEQSSLLQETCEAVFARDTGAALDIVKRVDAFGSNMRHFCQELISWFRNLLLMHAAGEAADLSDLSEAELETLRDQAKKIPLADVQRHLALLVKADSEMAHSSFPRLVMEMALVRMATLVPVVPVDELLLRLKSLEEKLATGVVASEQPIWEKQSAAPQRPPISSARESQQHPPKLIPTPAKEAMPAPSTVVAKEDSAPSWDGFVSFLKGKKPLLASQLEHGRPLALSGELLKIGYPAGSFELENLSQPDVRDELKKWVNTYFRYDPKIVLSPLSADVQDVPPSLAEKKSIEAADRLKDLKRNAAAHPAVSAALEVFGGELKVSEEEDAKD